MRARGLAVFLTVVFGSVTVVAYGWGYVARWLGLDSALLVSAAGALVAIPLVWNWKLARSESVDLTAPRCTGACRSPPSRSKTAAARFSSSSSTPHRPR